MLSVRIDFIEFSPVYTLRILYAFKQNALTCPDPLPGLRLWTPLPSPDPIVTYNNLLALLPIHRPRHCSTPLVCSLRFAVYRTVCIVHCV